MFGSVGLRSANRTSVSEKVALTDLGIGEQCWGIEFRV